MKCPKCGNKIKFVSGKAIPEGIDYLYICDSCSSCLRWAAKNILVAFVKFFIVTIIINLAAGLFFRPGTIMGYFFIFISGATLFFVFYKNAFKLEFCEIKPPGSESN